MSDTPRTDAAILNGTGWNFQDTVLADFARTLERELATATQAISNLPGIMAMLNTALYKLKDRDGRESYVSDEQIYIENSIQQLRKLQNT